MALEVVWSARANSELDNVIEYILNKWTEKELKKFFNRLDNSLLHISRSPQMFPDFHLLKGVKYCVVSKQSTLYFKIESTQVIIISLFDNRRNPSNKNF